MVIREVLGHVIRRVGLRDQWRTDTYKIKEPVAQPAAA